MKLPTLLSPVFLEIGHHSLLAVEGNRRRELPLDRLENGRLSPASKETLAAGLRAFLGRRTLAVPRRAFCAVRARGVSLRRITLPPAVDGNVEQLLRLQIEKEFPLPPDDLAWGSLEIETGEASPGRSRPAVAASVPRQWVVVAAKREILDEYRTILLGCGLRPVFTLAAWAGSILCPPSSDSFALLDIGPSQSELILFENRAPISLRSFPWGAEQIARFFANRSGTSQPDIAHCPPPGPPPDPSNPQALETVHPALLALAPLLNGDWQGRTLYLAGSTAQLPEMAAALAAGLGNRIACTPVAEWESETDSIAVLGLKRAWEQNGQVPALSLRWTEPGVPARIPASPAQWKWVALAALLALACFSLRYVEPLFKSGSLSRRLAALEGQRSRLPEIDRELSFLEFLHTNQPPYLEVLSTLANATPPGTRFDSLTMNRQGELSLRGHFQNVQQTAELRSKLINSGLFSTVVIDEQTPTPDRQRVLVRLTARWVRSREAAARPAPTPPAPAKPDRS